MRGASFAGSWSPFLGRERATVGVDVDPERRRLTQTFVNFRASARFQLCASLSLCASSPSIVLCIQAACSGDTPFARANCTIS